MSKPRYLQTFATRKHIFDELIRIFSFTYHTNQKSKIFLQRIIFEFIFSFLLRAEWIKWKYDKRIDYIFHKGISKRALIFVFSSIFPLLPLLFKGFIIFLCNVYGSKNCLSFSVFRFTLKYWMLGKSKEKLATIPSEKSMSFYVRLFSIYLIFRQSEPLKMFSENVGEKNEKKRIK